MVQDAVLIAGISIMELRPMQLPVEGLEFLSNGFDPI
jgi:hypothetical protein